MDKKALGNAFSKLISALENSVLFLFSIQAHVHPDCLTYVMGLANQLMALKLTILDFIFEACGFVDKCMI
ncbi:hypothetical protein [Psychromonas antarctica]|uniref:hypothetical protein n=1 Tax=Psychromonas antarctica TaxID=67573 RepID=UPI001EE7BC85|nr:hypothetical protein [Psychromonas antarctica]MCG6201644.1 hypothetical protein [Psychromonas antarctica]